MASVKITYEGKNITADLQPLMESFSYTDKTEGESDDISITLNNSDLRFLDEWHPEFGDTIIAEITDDEGAVIQCGTFQVDEGTADGGRDGGDTYTIKAIASGVKATTKTKRSVSHENKTLAEIINKVAARNGYTVQGKIKTVKIAYEAQWRETDISFLHRLSYKYGYYFSIRGKKITFYPLDTVHQRNSVAVITRSDCVGGYSINEKITEVYSKGKHKKRNTGVSKVLKDLKDAGIEVAPNTLEMRDEVDDGQESAEVTESKLKRKNLEQISVSFGGLKGSAYYMSGNSIDVPFLRKLSGKYIISECTHSLGRDGGHTVSVTGKKL